MENINKKQISKMINQDSSKDNIDCEYYINERSGLLDELNYPGSIVMGTEDIIRVHGSSKIIKR